MMFKNAKLACVITSVVQIYTKMLLHNTMLSLEMVDSSLLTFLLAKIWFVLARGIMKPNIKGQKIIKTILVAINYKSKILIF